MNDTEVTSDQGNGGSNQILTLGQYLKNERTKKNLPLKIVAQRTKISMTNLEALEEDRYDQLPNKAYLVGFVKSYVKILAADLDTALDLLNQYHSVKKSTSVPLPATKILATAAEMPRSKRNEPEFPLAKVVLSSFVVLIIVTAVVFMGTKQTNEAPVAEVVKPQSVSSETPLMQTEELEATIPVEETPKVLTPAVTLTTKEIVDVPTQPTVTAPVSPPETKVETDEVISDDSLSEIVFRDINSSLFSIITMSPADYEKYLPANARVRPSAGEHSIFVNAVDGDTWITYKTDDQEIRKFVLQQGRTLLIQGKVTRMFLGNVNVTKIFFNSQPIDPQSRTGVKSLVFPDEAGRHYKLPLFVYPDNGAVLTSEEYLKSLKRS